MALDYSQYLRDKFQEDFQEAEKQFGQNLPPRSQLREILEYIQKEEKFKRSSVVIQMKDCFMKLNDALADCIMFEENSTQKALVGSSSRKILPSARPCKDYWLFIKTWLRLRSIRREMESKGSDLGGEDDRGETHPFIYGGVTRRDAQNPFEELFDPRNVKYHGLDEQAKRIQDFLRQGKDAIAIVGMGGSGKTAPARKLLIETYKNQFEVSAWISLTEAIDPHNLTVMKVDPMSEITFYHEIYFMEFWNSFDMEMYKYMVGRGKKVLIVVDGIWHATDEFKYLTHRMLNRMHITVIVTSRMEGVAKSLAPSGKNFYLHRMEPPKEEDCWSIFEDSIKRKQLTTSDGKLLSLQETEILQETRMRLWKSVVGFH